MLRSVLVSVLALAMYLQGATVPFSNTAESQEALVAWEMVHGGNWILPRVNGELIPSKPPLYHWIVIAFAKLAGDVDELSSRLPSIVSASVTVGIVHAVAAAEWGTVAGLASAVALATSPEWVKWATTARTDATFALFLTSAFLLGHRWLRSASSFAILGLAVTIGAATLSKGFAGAGLVGIVLGIEIWRRHAWNVLRPTQLAVASLLFVAIACSWYAAALGQAGFAFFHKQIVLENVLRFLPNEAGGPSRKHSLLFYLPILFAGFLPWSFALPGALVRGYRERLAGSALSGYLVAWLAVVFAVCTVASGKRSNYLLPLYPAAAMLVGRELSALLAAARSGLHVRLLAAMGATAAGSAAAVAIVLVSWRGGFEPWGPLIPWLHPQDRVLLPRMAELLGPPEVWAVLAVAALAAALAVATVRRAWGMLYVGIAGTVLLATALGCRVVPQLETALKSFAPFTERVSATVAARRLAFFRAADLATLFYLRRHVPIERGSFAGVRRPSYLLVWRKDWTALPSSERGGVEVVDASPPASVGRPETELLLVRLDDRSG